MQGTYRVVPGDGVITRVGDGVVLAGTGSAADGGLEPRHLEALRDLDGTRFTSAIASLTPLLGPLAALAPAEHGWAVLVPEGMTVHTEYAERESVRVGPQHAVKQDPLLVAVLPGDTGRPRDVEGLAELGEGSATGAGVVLVAMPDEVAPLADATVLGRRCSCGLLVAPTALWCWACATPTDDLPDELEMGHRPSLGTLVTDVGRRTDLLVDHVVGREPGRHPDVEEGTAVPLPLTDHSHLISRVHAEIRLEGWDVVLTDLSANGTRVRPADGWRWDRIEPGVPHLLVPGSAIQLGHRVLQVLPPGV